MRLPDKVAEAVQLSMQAQLQILEQVQRLEARLHVVEQQNDALLAQTAELANEIHAQPTVEMGDLDQTVARLTRALEATERPKRPG